MDDERYLLRAIDLAARASSKGNEPFGALIVDPDGNVLVEAENTVVTARDCTAHAETNAVRESARGLICRGWRESAFRSTRAAGAVGAVLERVRRGS